MSLSGLDAGVTPFRPSRNASRLEAEGSRVASRDAVCDEPCDDPFDAMGFSTVHVGLGYSVALSTTAWQPSRTTSPSRVATCIDFSCRSNILSPSHEVSLTGVDQTHFRLFVSTLSIYSVFVFRMMFPPSSRKDRVKRSLRRSS